MELYVLFAVAYVVGTAFGLWVGFKSGVRKGADATIETLMLSKFLLFKRHSNGDIEFIRPEDSAEYQQNQ
jgi:hypothetical protein